MTDLNLMKMLTEMFVGPKNNLETCSFVCFHTIQQEVL